MSLMVATYIVLRLRGKRGQLTLLPCDLGTTPLVISSCVSVVVTSLIMLISLLAFLPLTLSSLQSPYSPLLFISFLSPAS